MAPMRSVVIGPEFDYDVYMSHVVGEREYVIIDLMQLILVHGCGLVFFR